MIGELYEALAAVLAVWAHKSTARYKPAADGFSFDAEPRANLTAYYVEPAQTRQAVGYVGGGGLDVAMVTIWASLEARDQAAAGLALANDLQRLRAAIRDADLGDVNLHPTFETSVAPRADDGIAVTGRIRFECEIES